MNVDLYWFVSPLAIMNLIQSFFSYIELMFKQTMYNCLVDLNIVKDMVKLLKDYSMSTRKWINRKLSRASY